MHVRVGLTDGRIIVTDNSPDSVIQDQIDECDGKIGERDYDRVRVEDIDDAIAFIEQMWSMMLGDTDATFTFIVAGEEIAFSGDKVAWFRFVRDSD